jgi:membrane associated rhomboid family serine protease
MTTTPVGMRCPECARQRTEVRNPRGTPGSNDTPATYALIALSVAAFFGEIATGGTLLDGGGTLTDDGSLYAYFANGFTESGVAGGQPYRILTTGFLHAGILHLGLNMFMLFILGRLLEPAIGTPRFVALYVASLLGGSCMALILDPDQSTVGASGAVFGLMGSAFVIARQRGLDELASQVGILLLLNLAFTFRPGISVGAHIGGLIVGGLAALLIAYVERSRLPNRNAIELAGLVLLCLVAAAGSLIAAQSYANDFM